MIKFISYTGEYPCLCMGILTLEIDGDIIRFGNKYVDKDINYRTFWSSGGSCGFIGDYEDEYVDKGEWIINEEDLPPQYQKYSKEITKLFNENVLWGCCGGCL